MLDLFAHVVQQDLAKSGVLGVLGPLPIPVDGVQLLHQRDDRLVMIKCCPAQPLPRSVGDSLDMLLPTVSASARIGGGTTRQGRAQELIADTSRVSGRPCCRVQETVRYPHTLARAAEPAEADKGQRASGLQPLPPMAFPGSRSVPEVSRLPDGLADVPPRVATPGSVRKVEIGAVAGPFPGAR